MPFNDGSERVSATGPAAPPAPALDLDQAYGTWAASPRAPQDNRAMLDALDPTIDRAARAHTGQTNPLIRSHARVLAMTALQSFNPKGGARLSSHVFSHLQGLKRYTGQIAQGVAVPERVTLDRRAVDLATNELNDRLGRDPNDEELADHVGLSSDRIRYVRTARPAMAEGFFSGLGEDGGGLAPGVKGPESDAWLRLAYGDLAPVDKLIFEHTLGWNGKPRLQNQQLAAKLRRSPGWVSQRKLAIQKFLDRGDELNPFAG